MLVQHIKATLLCNIAQQYHWGYHLFCHYIMMHVVLSNT